MKKIIGGLMALNALNSVYLFLVVSDKDYRLLVGANALVTGGAAYYLL